VEPLPPSQPGRLYRLAWALYLAMALGGVLWIGVREGRIPLELFFDPGGWWVDLAAGLAGGLLLLALWRGAERTFARARDLERQLASLLGRLSAPEAFGLAALSGFSEELFFRGAVQGSFGWVAATLLFALLHTGPGPAFRFWTLFAALAGLLFAGLMVWRGNLLAPVVAHFLVNFVNLGRLAGQAADRPAGEPEDSARLPSGEAPSPKD
jgi:uncharacterized protein